MDKDTYELRKEWASKNLEEINKEIITYKDKIRKAKQVIIILEKQKRQYEVVEGELK